MTTVIKVTTNGFGLGFSHRYLEANNWLLLLGLRPCIRGRPKAVHARCYSLSNSGDRLFVGLMSAGLVEHVTLGLVACQVIIPPDGPFCPYFLRGLCQTALPTKNGPSDAICFAVCCVFRIS